jgi:sorting nexin-29
MGIIVPILKKGDKTMCDNYRGITILNTAYKVFSSVLYSRLMIYGEEILGEYQCGFRPNRSTIDHIHLMRQTMEKAHEYNLTLHHLFIDFKQAFASVNKDKMLQSLKILGIPLKLVRLIKTTLTDTNYKQIQTEDDRPWWHYENKSKKRWAGNKPVKN